MEQERIFSYYYEKLPCTYGMTVKLDITAIKSSGKKLYPALLCGLTRAANRHEEFRTAMDEKEQIRAYLKAF